LCLASSSKSVIRIMRRFGGRSSDSIMRQTIDQTTFEFHDPG
jgi:hypothetical protein